VGIPDRGESVAWKYSCSVGQSGEHRLYSPRMLKLKPDHTNRGGICHRIPSSRAEGARIKRRRTQFFILRRRFESTAGLLNYS
jgi:hypothetical protein